jgi:hypothetical protein
MLELSDEAKRLVSTFLAYRNDIDIYTEDELKDKEFYSVLFTRLLEKAIKVNDITPLGSRKNVIDRCQSEPDNGRKKLFIIDGDVKFIHGRDIPELPTLFVLEGYCIENFVFDSESIINFIYLNCASKSKGVIESELKNQEWLKIYANKFVDLFLHFAVVDFFGGKYALFNANKFHSKAGYDEELVDKEIEKLKGDVLALTSQELYQAKIQELRSIWSYDLETLLKIVSGKDYLIPMLLFKVQDYKKSKALPAVEEAKFLLAHHCSLERLSSLKSAILNL